MQTIRLTSAQALIKFLNQQYINIDGVEIKFVEGIVGIFGHGSVLGLGEAIADKTLHQMKFYRANNEQGCGHMAMGFAKQHRRKKMMACVSSVGPGALNMVTSAATATANRIPVLFIPGDIFASRQPDPVLQQIEQEHDYSISSNDAFKPVSKYWDRISRPEQLMSACINAFRVLTDPAATGAVTLSLPQDVAAESWDYPAYFFDKRVHYQQRRAISAPLVDRLVALIKNKKKPMLLMGGGVRYSDADEALIKFAERFHIPMTQTHAGRSVVMAEHPLNMGGLGTTGTQCANLIAKESDCLIAVGTRLNDFHTSSKWAFKNPDLQVICLNVNAMDAYKFNGEPVLCDAREGLTQLHRGLNEVQYTSQWQNQPSSLKQSWLTEVSRLTNEQSKEANKINQPCIMGMLNNPQIVDKNAIMVFAGGSIPSDMERLWQDSSQDGYHSEYAYSCMGYEIAGAIGAKLAQPEREVFVILGDGAYLMYHQELVMAVQENININVILIDNGGWQCIDNLQTNQGVRRFGCELRHRNSDSDELDGDYVAIDFAMNAQSYGVKSFKANNNEALTDALKNAQQHNGPTLIEIKSPSKSMTEGYESWWHAGVPEVSNTKAVEKANQIMKQHLSEARKF